MADSFTREIVAHFSDKTFKEKIMSNTDKDKPRKHRRETDHTNYKRHGGLMARNYAGYGGVKCPCCGIDDDSFKKKDRRLGKQEIKQQLADE